MKKTKKWQNLTKICQIFNLKPKCKFREQTSLKIRKGQQSQTQIWKLKGFRKTKFEIFGHENDQIATLQQVAVGLAY